MRVSGGISKRERFPARWAVDFYAGGPVDTPSDSPENRRMKKRQRCVAQERKRRRSIAEAKFQQWLADGELKAWGHGIGDGTAIDPGRWLLGVGDWDHSALKGKDWRISGIAVDGLQLETLLLEACTKTPSLKHRPGPKPPGYENLQNRIHDLTEEILAVEKPGTPHGWKGQIRAKIAAQLSAENISRETVNRYSGEALRAWEQRQRNGPNSKTG